MSDIDYRDLLKRYMKAVLVAEGYDYLAFFLSSESLPTGIPVTDEEMRELEEISEQASDEIRNGQ